MDWYAGSSPGVKLAVIGWHTGVLGKLVFLIGVATVVIVVGREFGIDLRPQRPKVSWCSAWASWQRCSS